MKESCKQLVVPLDKNLATWLESKAAEGYKKASLVRAILHREMDAENLPSGVEGEEPSGENDEGNDGDAEGDDDED